MCVLDLILLKMCDQWVGNIVSIDCGDSLGFFQGKVSAVNNTDQTVSLTKVFHNGLPSKVPSVTIR